MENKKKLNILILSWRGPGHPNAGGAEISSHEHAKGWVREGHKVTLFTSFFSGAKKEEIVDGVQIKRQGFEVFGVQLKAAWWYFLKKKERFDLVIDEFHGIPFFTPLYIRVKKIGFIHEVAKEVWSLNSWVKPYNLIPAFLGTTLEPLIFKLFYKNIPFMTVSDSTKEDLISWGIPSQNITIMHNGVTIPAKVRKFVKEKVPTLIFLGAISRDKGIEEALRVFSIIHKKNAKCKFWIVGKAEKNYLNYLKTFCKRLNIEQNTIFFGFVTEEKKFELLSRSHLLVNTSVREGWGLVVIEAASVGTPTIAFDVAGLKDSIVDGISGLLCKGRDINELATIIKNTLDDKNLLDKLSLNAKNWSKKFKWENSVVLSLQLIDKIAG